MIELIDLEKTYTQNGQKTIAIQDINLNVANGCIFGIIGKSGAGKSTLIRCVNLLEQPSYGDVVVNGHYLRRLSPADLRKARSEIGMIFQHFNLLSSLNVWENIEFPLKLTQQPKLERDHTIERLLELTGLTHHRFHYPAELSGGQKQRVAIARALACQSKVLLCDEATSALDPQTTTSILQLLKEINKELGITILLITHEMAVIKSICDQVALLDHGHIIEQNDVFTFFTEPKHPLAKELTVMSLQNPLPDMINHQLQPTQSDASDQTILRIFFFGHAAERPLISHLVQNFMLDINILQANIEFIKEQPIGIMFVAVSGEQIKLLKAIQYLQNQDVHVEVMGYVSGTIRVTR
jgi:D-methionine transport system ATP-binding protein